jgi:histidinol dehydrogenase
MMQVFKNPQRKDWKIILARPTIDSSDLFAIVSGILKEVQTNGDAALRKYTKDLDGVDITELKLSSDEIDIAVKEISEELKKAIQKAAENITCFHKAQLTPVNIIETMPGINCWQRSVGIEKVGLYIPAGSAPLFSTLLMLGIPAKLASCKEIIVCTPAKSDGTVDAAIRYTASLLGIRSIYKIGGAQAIAAMAYGTETIPQVFKIFGPGNQYVTAAKQLVQLNGVAIDMPAGPSEVCILADETADAAYVAADLLSQAEHGKDSQCILITNSSSLIETVKEQLVIQTKELKRSAIIEQSMLNAKAILVTGIDEGIAVANEYAPEHLIITTKDDDEVADKIVNAGSVFLGMYSPESAGDYASGTNHTLPTNGYAKAYSGVSVDSFSKKITYQRLTKQGLNNISATIITMAEAEGLDAHANAVKIRSDV